MASETQNSKPETLNWLFLDHILDCGCLFCYGKPVNATAAEKVIRRIEDRLRLNQSPSAEALHVLRMLVRSAQPLQAATFQKHLQLDARGVKAIMRELRDEWLLPVCAMRRPPYGYFIAATLEQCDAWFKTTMNQGVSEIITAYKVRRANFPEFAGQDVFEFVTAVSKELGEAVKEAA